MVQNSSCHRGAETTENALFTRTSLGKFGVEVRIQSTRRIRCELFWRTRGDFVLESTWPSRAWSGPSSCSARPCTSITKSCTTFTSSIAFAAAAWSLSTRIDDIPSGANVLYSAHGVAPAIRTAAVERNLHAIDATCPLVTKVHLEAVRFAKEGYTILLIGHEGHDEVAGTLGEAPDAIRLVQDAAEVERLDLPDDAKVAYLTQTTLSVDDAEVIICGPAQAFPAHCRPQARRHLLCHAKSARSGQGAAARSRPGAGGRQSKQLQQPAPGRAGPQPQQARLSGGWRARDSAELAARRSNRAHHGRGQCAGRRGAGTGRVSCRIATAPRWSFAPSARSTSTSRCRGSCG